jgi:SAM-dependent methyltransferase
LRVLEVGAGTGGTTTALLPLLPAESTEYVYSDISSAFLAAAEERFARYPFVTYRVVDIERSPQMQGLTPGSFDIVVAANVLHATRDVAGSVGPDVRVAPGLVAFCRRLEERLSAAERRALVRAPGSGRFCRGAGAGTDHGGAFTRCDRGPRRVAGAHVGEVLVDPG